MTLIGLAVGMIRTDHVRLSCGRTSGWTPWRLGKSAARTRCCDRPGMQHGFNLIELVVVMAIVVILAIIVIPSYRRYVMKSDIQTAQAALMSMANNLRQYAQDHETYVSVNGGCPVIPPPTEDFTLSCPTLTTTTYTIQATGTGSLSGFTFTLDQNGDRSSTTGVASGWTGNSTCWISDPQGDCAVE